MILALPTSRKILKIATSRYGVMAQWLGILAALPKDPHGCPQPSVTAAPEEVMPPSSLCWHQTHMWYIDTLAGKILVHIKRKGLFKKKWPPGTIPSVKRNGNGEKRGTGVDKKETNSKGIKMFQKGRAQEWSTHHVSGSYVLVKVPVSRMIRSICPCFHLNISTEVSFPHPSVTLLSLSSTP